MGLRRRKDGMYDERSLQGRMRNAFIRAERRRSREHLHRETTRGCLGCLLILILVAIAPSIPLLPRGVAEGVAILLGVIIALRFIHALGLLGCLMKLVIILGCIAAASWWLQNGGAEWIDQLSTPELDPPERIPEDASRPSEPI